MFEINDVIVYQNGGVCKIVDICTPDFVDTDDKYYKMQPVDNVDSTIYVKINQQNCTIRPIITSEEANGYLKNCRDVDGIYVKDLKVRDKEFNETLRTCECEKWFALLKGIMNEQEKKRKQGKRLTSGDDRNRKRVERLLSTEFSSSLGITAKEAKKMIQEAMSEQ